MSSAAQILLHGLPSGGEPPAWQGDVERIHQSALGIYRLARKQLAAPKDLHVLRHEMRGLLQDILGRCQVVLEDDERKAGANVRQELESIIAHAFACVDVLNGNRDGAVPSDDEASAVAPAGSPVAFTADDEPEQPVERARILVADDSAGSREVLGRFLESQGHEVVFARTGREALARAEEADFDLILLDVVMPELNGFEVLKVLRRRHTLRHTFVLIISGLDAGTNAIRGIELGAVDFLTRPIDLRLLRARVNACLERHRLRERELSQYFTPKLARYLMRHREELNAGRRVEVSVLFGDIVGFSRVSELHDPDRTIRWLGDVLERLSSCVMEEEGVLVNYTGDQIMALWGAPRDQPDHADRACRTAQAMQRAVPGLDAAWSRVLGLPTTVAVGINTGEAYVGNIGTPQKFTYGALGNSVNLASRVLGACKFARTNVLVTGDTITRLSSPMPSRRLGQVRVANIAAAVSIHELGPAEPDDRWRRLQSEYEAALKCFEARDLSKASSLLGGLLDEYPEDGPSLILMSRAVEEMLRGSPERFDPVWELPGK